MRSFAFVALALCCWIPSANAQGGAPGHATGLSPSGGSWYLTPGKASFGPTEELEATGTPIVNAAIVAEGTPILRGPLARRGIGLKLGRELGRELAQAAQAATPVVLRRTDTTRWATNDRSSSRHYDLKADSGWRTLSDDQARRVRALVPKAKR